MKAKVKNWRQLCSARFQLFALYENKNQYSLSETCFGIELKYKGIATMLYFANDKFGQF